MQDTLVTLRAKVDEAFWREEFSIPSMSRGLCGCRKRSEVHTTASVWMSHDIPASLVANRSL